MSKITITGASGFVGSNLMEIFKSTHEVQPLSIRYISNNKIELSGDVIIHLSGKAHDLKIVTQSQEYYEANYELTKQLFDSFLLSNASVFIFMSSVKAVADEVEGVLTEETTPNPKTHYGISKLQAENYILDQELSNSKRVYILRPSMIHGPGNKGNLNLLYSFVNKGYPWPLVSFENQRSFLSIDNLCFVINEIVENELMPSGIYNVADNQAISTNQLITLLSKSQNKIPKTLAIPKKIIVILAIIGDILRLPLNSERLQKLTESYVVNNLKIVAAISKPLPISAEEGLIKTFNSFNNAQ
jgi:nucleoside-diphosphate-sugar epimerase